MLDPLMPDEPGDRLVSPGGAPPTRAGSPPVMLELLGPDVAFGEPDVRAPPRVLPPSDGSAARPPGVVVPCGVGVEPPQAPEGAPPRAPDQPGILSPGGRAVPPPRFPPVVPD